MCPVTQLTSGRGTKSNQPLVVNYKSTPHFMPPRTLAAVRKYPFTPFFGDVNTACSLFLRRITPSLRPHELQTPSILYSYKGLEFTAYVSVTAINSVGLFAGEATLYP